MRRISKDDSKFLSKYLLPNVSKNLVNKKWENHGTQFYNIFENFDLNEESRFHFIKLNVSQVIANIEEAYKNTSGVILNVNSQVSKLNNTI